MSRSIPRKAIHAPAQSFDIEPTMYCAVCCSCACKGDEVEVQ
jgi:hypothetical protein